MHLEPVGGLTLKWKKSAAKLPHSKRFTLSR
jgi:hypothetical protein